MTRRWQGAPQTVRITVLGLVVVLAYVAAVHLVQLVANDFHPYATLPAWLAGWLAADLLRCPDGIRSTCCPARGPSPPQGVALAVAVLVSDAAANGFANYALDPAVGVTAGRVGQTVITMLALGACLVAPQLWRTASLLRLRA